MSQEAHEREIKDLRHNFSTLEAKLRQDLKTQEIISEVLAHECGTYKNQIRNEQIIERYTLD
jgi:hypothetical protein